MDHIPVSSSGGGGNSWPPALRRRLGLPSATSKASNNEELSADVDILTTTQSSPVTHTISSSSLSSHELRRYIHKTYSTLTSIQRQLHRGEESYFEQSYSHGNLLQGWDNIWIEQHNHNHNLNSYTSYTNSSGGGMYSSSGLGGEDGSSNNNVSNHNYAHHMNNHNNNKSIPIRKMPAEYRWFTSSCGTNLPVTSTDNSNGGTSGSGSGSGRVAALERWSLIDRPPTPELQEKQVVIEEDVDNSLKKKKNDANIAVTSLTDNRIREEVIGSRSKNTTEVSVAVQVESNMASTMANKSQVNGKEADAAERTMDIDPLHQSNEVVVKGAEYHFIKGQASKVANTEPQSYRTLSSGQSSTDAELVIEKMVSPTLVSKMKKDRTNDTARLPDASSSSNIQSSSDAISSSTAAAADDDKDQTNTASVQSNKQTEATSSNGKNSTDNNVSGTMMDHPKNSITDDASSEKTGRATVNKEDTSQEQDSSTSVSLPQSKRARLDTNQLPKNDCCADDNDTSSNMHMNANLSNELVDDQETNIKVQQSEPIEEEEKKTETLPTSSTSVADGSRTSSSRRSTRKRKTTS